MELAALERMAHYASNDPRINDEQLMALITRKNFIAAILQGAGERGEVAKPTVVSKVRGRK